MSLQNQQEIAINFSAAILFAIGILEMEASFYQYHDTKTTKNYQLNLCITKLV